MAAEFKSLCLTINREKEMIEILDQAGHHMVTVSVIRTKGKNVRLLLQAPPDIHFQRVDAITGEQKRKRDKPA